MAKQQYYFTKKPMPIFPAFNPAVIQVQASGYAVQEAQHIIDSGVFPDGTNLLRNLTDSGATRWFGTGATVTVTNGIIKAQSAGGIYPCLQNDSPGIIAWSANTRYVLSFWGRANDNVRRNIAIGNMLPGQNIYQGGAKGSDFYISASGENKYTRFYDLTAEAKRNLRGQSLTVSFDYMFENVVMSGNSTGFQFFVKYTDGTQTIIHAMMPAETTAVTKSGRFSVTTKLQDKEIDNITSFQPYMYVQTASGTATAGRPKFEIGTVATPWTPTPEETPGAKATASIPDLSGGYITPLMEVSFTDEWKYYTIAFTSFADLPDITNQTIQFFCGDGFSTAGYPDTTSWIEIADVKIEKGFRSSPYTPSPYDVVVEYDPTNFTALPIKVTPKYPNEDIGTVSIGVATMRNGEYEGDIAKIARRLFKNIIKEAPVVSPELASDITWSPYIDYNLRADMEVEEIGSYTALNAVRQLNTQLTFNRLLFAINAPVVQYENYPLSVALVNGDADNLLQITTEGEAALFAVTKEPHVVVDIPDGTTKVIATNVSGITKELTVSAGCIADNPFYVRWVNTIGGYDYHMFNTRKQYAQERTDTVNIQRADISDESDTQLTASFKIERRIDTGIDNLTREEYDKLSGILKSPRIQWWDEEYKQWVTVLCGDQSNTWDTNSGLGSIEVTFIYPRTLLQQ